MDIVERLRSRSARSQGGMDKLDDEAADEIERLRALIRVEALMKGMTEDEIDAALTGREQP